MPTATTRRPARPTRAVPEQGDVSQPPRRAPFKSSTATFSFLEMAGRARVESLRHLVENKHRICHGIDYTPRYSIVSYLWHFVFLVCILVYQGACRPEFSLRYRPPGRVGFYKSINVSQSISYNVNVHVTPTLLPRHVHSASTLRPRPRPRHVHLTFLSLPHKHLSLSLINDVDPAHRIVSGPLSSTALLVPKQRQLSTCPRMVFHASYFRPQSWLCRRGVCMSVLEALSCCCGDGALFVRGGASRRGRGA